MKANDIVGWTGLIAIAIITVLILIRTWHLQPFELEKRITALEENCICKQ